MIRKAITFLLLMLLTIPAFHTPVYGASTCTLRYYYTSERNPESVPKEETIRKSGASWKVKPAAPSKSSYTKTVNGKTMTYTFDGWYTNINCIGKKILPGKATTALIPSKTLGKDSIRLYGRWIYTEKRTESSRGMQPASDLNRGAPMSASSAANPAVTSASDPSGRSAPDSSGSTSDSPQTNGAPESDKLTQTIKAMSAFTFSDKGQSVSVDARASSGLPLVFASSRPEIVSISKKGIMKSISPGTAVIRIRQKGNEHYEPAEVSLTVAVAGYRGREAALAGWRHLLIDTFFHINGRKYSLASPGKYWRDSQGNWSGKTGRKGNTQSCITLPTVSLKRTGIISYKSGSIWLRSNMASSPNRTVRRLKKTSLLLNISYPHKSLKYLAANNKVKFGDILCRSGHTFVYMGKDAEGHPLIYESGSRRNIGNGTSVTWGHHRGGHANKLTGKINKQIRRSDAVGAKWKKGMIRDESFKGHRASGKNLNGAIHIVCSIRTFKVKTRCTNGTITLGNTYMAGQNITIHYAPSQGRRLEFIEVDGRRVNRAHHKSEYCFSRLSADHTVNVVYR